MKIRILLQLSSLIVLLLGISINGLFFSYPKNALVEFFQSLHKKKEMKKPQSIHHYHLHYYPVHTQVWTKPVKAPEKIELEKLHSNHLESLGWSDNEFNFVPEPTIYRPPPIRDPWIDASLTRPWDDDSDPPKPSKHEQSEVPKSGIIIQVPLHQNIILQQPEVKEEKPDKNPLVTFFEKLRRIKNSIFSNRSDNDEEKEKSKPKSNISDKLNAYVVYFRPEIGRK